MSFLDRFFGNNGESDKSQPKLKFGRYTDSYKTKFQYDNWDKALDEFEEENYLEQYSVWFTQYYRFATSAQTVLLTHIS